MDAKKLLGIAVIGLGLGACSSDKVPDLLYLNDGGPGPDEFAILPTKPLEAPEDFAALPEPTPGGVNRTDPNPEADAVAALGGDPSRVIEGGGVRDSALIAQAGRFGTDSAIRDVLAAEDLRYRQAHPSRLLERLFKVSRYYKAYAPLSLDQYAELERFRRSGIWTPAVPPDPAADD